MILFYLHIHLIFALVGISTEFLQCFRFKSFADSIFSLKFHDSNYLPLGDVFAILYLFIIPANQFSVAYFDFVCLFLSRYFHGLASPFHIFYFSLLTFPKLFVI
jgi:hypothetical protein